jgi:hypothetical protein
MIVSPAVDTGGGPCCGGRKTRERSSENLPIVSSISSVVITLPIEI